MLSEDVKVGERYNLEYSEHGRIVMVQHVGDYLVDYVYEASETLACASTKWFKEHASKIPKREHDG